MKGLGILLLLVVGIVIGVLGVQMGPDYLKTYLPGPVDPDSGVMIKEDIPAATEMILKNMGFALDKVGSRLPDVIKVTVFLTDMGNFEQMNNVYKTFFPENPPARSCIAVKGLPMGSPIEIEAIATR